MKEMVYTLAAWRVQEGRQQAFISAWKNLVLQRDLVPILLHLS